MMQEGNARTWRRADFFFLALAVLLVGFHSWQAFRCFPDLRALTDHRPVIQVDHALHLYHGSIGSQFLREHGANWGYDPFFMAGYPKTPYHDPSAGLSDLSQFLAGGGYHPAAYKIGLLVTVIAFPLALLLACGLLRTGLAAANLTLALAIWYYWTSFAKTMLDTGLYSFLFSSVWLGAVCGCVCAWHRRPAWTTWLLLVSVTTFAVFMHPTVSLLLAGPMGLFYLVCCRGHGWKWHLAVWLAAGLVVASNAFWLVPFWKLWPLRRQGYVFMATAPDDWGYVFDFYYNSPLPALLMAAAVCGVAGWGKARQWDMLASLGSLLALLFGLTFFGSCWSATRGLEPLRFQVPLHVLAAIPAGQTLAFLLRQLRTGTWKARTGVVVCLLFTTFWMWSQHQFLRTVQSFRYLRKLEIGLHPSMVQLCKWIRENTNPGHRILLEDQLRLLEATVAESLHWTCLLPIYTDQRQYIGGQYQQVPLHHHVASMGDFHLAERPIESFSDEQIAEYLRRYNIGTILCWSERTRRVFDRLGFLKKVAALPRYTIRPDENAYHAYQVLQPSSFFQQGTGTIASVGLNRLVLENVQPEDGLVIVRYHWLETFATVPPLPLERIAVPDDPIGFIGIRVDRPLQRLEIVNSYRGGRHSLMFQPSE